ncbi:TPA: transcriptional regulator, partial [Enterococcus faecium]
MTFFFFYSIIDKSIVDESIIRKEE